MLGRLKYSLVVAAFCLLAANATTVGVLEIMPANDEMDLSIDETRFLTDELRRQAIQYLPKDYFIPSRDRIISLVPETAENLNSAIEIGIVIKSDYVTRSFIGKLEDLFTLTVELYEIKSGIMLGDFVKESADLKGLLNAIRENSPSLFAKIPANVPAKPKNSNKSYWNASLYVLGSVALGLGVYYNTKADDYYKESRILQYSGAQSDFEAKYKEAQNTKTARNIFYATGSALLLGGIMVSIWF